MRDPISMLLWCPSCGARHLDVGEFATKSHHTHACQSCGMVWRPAIESTCGVQFLPGFKNEPLVADHTTPVDAIRRAALVVDPDGKVIKDRWGGR